MPGRLVHQQDQRDLVHRERAIALADLDLVEAAAVFQPLLDRVGAACVERRAQRDAGERQHRVVAERGVAVDADLGDRFRRRGCGCGRLGQRQQRAAIAAIISAPGSSR